MGTAPETSRHLRKFSNYQKLVIAILALLQFTIILDFMIISPLGAILMPALSISPAQFGTVVSAYAFSAGASGLLAAGFADRFDRKKLLLFLYLGFIVGTFLCGISWSFQMLFFSRMFAGIFGGVVGSVVLAIATDLFPLEMRGRVLGYIQTAFAASQVLGIPAGLYFSNLWGWHAPFFMIVIVGGLLFTAILFFLKPVDAHLKLRNDKNAFLHLIHTLLNRQYTLAFLMTALLSTGGFMLMPFASDYIVNNVEIPMDRLPIIYLATGLAAIFMGPLIGRAADTFGKFRVFVFGGLLSGCMVLFYTHLGPTPLPVFIVINVLLFVGIFSRMIPAQALTSAIPKPENRGAFMAISSSLQQVSGGLASLIAGLIVIKSESGKLLQFDLLGYIVIGTMLTTIVMMYFIHKKIPNPSQLRRVGS